MEGYDARYPGGGEGCLPACHPFLSFLATAASTAALAVCLTNRQRGYHHHHHPHTHSDGGGAQPPWNVTSEGPWGEPLCPPWDDPDSTLPLLRISLACLVALAACSILGIAGQRCRPSATPAEAQSDRGRRQRRHRRTVRGGTIESGEPYEEIGAAPSEGEPMRVHPHAPRQTPSPHGGPRGGGDGPNSTSPGHAVLEAGGEAARAGSGRGIRGIGSRVGRDGEIEFHFHGEYATEPPGSVGSTTTAESAAAAAAAAAASPDDNDSPQGEAYPSKLRRALRAASKGVGLVLLSYSAQLPTQQCALVLCTTLWCISVEVGTPSPPPTTHNDASILKPPSTPRTTTPRS
jgi:hypothetical protein